MKAPLRLLGVSVIPSALLGLIPDVAHAGDSLSMDAISLRESLWFLVPFLLSVVILARIERWVRSLRVALKDRRRQRQLPGGSPLNPIPVDSFEQVRFTRLRRRCRCGELPQVAYEGPTTSNERKLWVQIEICPGCEDRVQTYFDVTAAQDPNPMVGQPLTPSSSSGA